MEIARLQKVSCAVELSFKLATAHCLLLLLLQMKRQKSCCSLFLDLLKWQRRVETDHRIAAVVASLAAAAAVAENMLLNLAAAAPVF